MRLDGFVTRAWLVALTLAACAARPCFAQDLPNIVLILPDDHGWEDLGFMGHPVIRTPHIDKLTSESLLFTRGYVPTALCRPSLATLVTGLYPHQLHNPVANLKYRTVVRQDGWKLIEPYEPNRSVTLTINGMTAEWMFLGPELYNVREDPHESKNLIRERPKIAEELRLRLDRWWPAGR